MAEFDAVKAGARADLCRFLSACYYEPGPEFTEEKLFDSMREAAARLHPDLAERVDRLAKAFTEVDTQTLLVDYTRLFLGPVQTLAKPYGSHWLSGEASVMQASTMAVLELYKQGGFEIDDSFNELPDHVAVELEFLYLLIHQRNQASGTGDAAGLSELTSLQQRFLREHLGAWIGPFTQGMQTHAETTFYRELGALSEHFVGLQEGSGGLAH